MDLLAAMREFAARHGGGTPEDGFAADELAAELHLTPLSAAGQLDYASTVARRLPGRLRRAGRRPDPPGPPADHRGRDQHLV